MTQKIADLVHAGNYAEAQKLTTGLLVAYPDDQRLIKAKALIEKLSAAPAPATPTTPASQPAQPAAKAEKLTGMDKVDYDALIELGQQAQQDADLAEQKKMLHQFMEQSAVFLQKHPDQVLLWQLRAAAAIILDEPMDGYEAGQKLFAGGVTDNTDPNVRRLLAQLKNKGWLDKQKANQEGTYLKPHQAITAAETKLAEALATNRDGWQLGAFTPVSFELINPHDGIIMAIRYDQVKLSSVFHRHTLGNISFNGYYVAASGEMPDDFPTYYERQAKHPSCCVIGWDTHHGADAENFASALSDLAKGGQTIQ